MLMSRPRSGTPGDAWLQQLGGGVAWLQLLGAAVLPLRGSRSARTEGEWQRARQFGS